MAAAPSEAIPVHSTEELLAYFHAAFLPRSEWRVGIEHEKFAVHAETGRAIGYGGERGVQRLFELLCQRFGWKPVLEEGLPIALERDGASLTLEPGGQVELSGKPVHTVPETVHELEGHLAEAREVGKSLGIWWIGLGAHPTCSADEIEWMPKQRYAIMSRYLPQRGKNAWDMMKRTCTVQANFDYSDEADAVRKMRVGMGASSIATAIFASSPVSAGASRGHRSERAAYWRNTDPDRTGLVRAVFEDGFSIRHYVEWALDVPMFFIRRQGRYVNLAGHPFRAFLQDGAAGEQATMADFELHLTTLFPEARMKRVIEVRGADAGSVRMVCALPALWKGLLYDDGAIDAAWDLVRAWTFDERVTLIAEVPRLGLEARIRGTPVLDLARELVRISREGLRRQWESSPGGPDERPYLEPVEEHLARGVSPADEILARWNGEWQGETAKLLAHARL